MLNRRAAGKSSDVDSAASEPGNATAQILPSRIDPSFDTLLEASGPQEAQWLRERGYPTAEQWANRNSIPDEALERRANLGDLVAMALWADRLSHREILKDSPQAVLKRATEKGSVFAAALASSLDVERVNRRNPDNVLLQQAALTNLMSVAAMGDPRPLALALASTASGWKARITAQDLLASHSRIAEIQEQRRHAGLPPVVFSPRPGHAEWQEREAKRQEELSRNRVLSPEVQQLLDEARRQSQG